MAENLRVISVNFNLLDFKLFYLSSKRNAFKGEEKSPEISKLKWEEDGGTGSQLLCRGLDSQNVWGTLGRYGTIWC